MIAGSGDSEMTRDGKRMWVWEMQFTWQPLRVSNGKVNQENTKWNLLGQPVDIKNQVLNNANKHND